MIVAGFGFSTRADTGSLREALARACEAAGIAAPDALSTAEDKAAALGPLAKGLGLPVHPIPHESLIIQVTQTHSERVAAERSTGSVAEAAALAGAGPEARLLTSRQHAEDRLASCALAKGAPS
ncbi:cobalamin biosynthesis protein [Roseovarius nitratireducens]|uniref:cobalamin biosynthesis protein n=1 Tax=Roseovarius nitratireducens TaxID=2044597 RepID=UPI000CE284AB|nr:cobalamin biosynthesis protein [Roseovarius nitratireducens]